MNMTLDHEKESIAYRKGVEDAKREFAAWLDGLPKDIASDLVDLFRLHSETEDSRLRAEITQTIKEIILPSSMQVEAKEAYDLNNEDSFVRDKLTAYRHKVGEEIKRRRHELGWSQEELAEKAGLSQSHLCRLETGVHVPTSATIERIATALNTTPSQLDPGFNDEDPGFNDEKESSET